MTEELEFNTCEKCHRVLANIGTAVTKIAYDSETEEVKTTYVCGNCAPPIES